MKKNLFAAFVVLLAAGSCVQKSPDNASSASVSEYESSAGADDGIQRMHVYDYADTVVVEGRKYTYSVHREASDSLPVITDDDGLRYADNIYTVTIAADGREFFHRSFTKNAFASSLSSDFRQRGLLDGMMLDRTLPGIAFAVSVSMPQSDMVEPLILHVDRQGGIAIERDERSDADLEDSADDSV